MLEATGGLESNWLHLFRELDEATDTDLKGYRFNPLVIRRFAEHQLHTNKTDEDAGLTLSLIAEDLLRLERRIDRLTERGKH